MGCNCEGGRIVARAWLDEDFKKRLLEDANNAVLDLGIGASNSAYSTKLTAVENTPDVHNIIVCTLCSCYPLSILGLSPPWYTHALTHTYTHTCIHTYTLNYTYTYTYANTNTNTYTYTYAYTYTYMFIYANTYMHIYLYIHILIHAGIKVELTEHVWCESQGQF